MTTGAYVWATGQRAGDHEGKLILLTLALGTEGSSNSTTPSLRRLVEYTECDEQTVRRWITEFINRGWVAWAYYDTRYGRSWSLFFTQPEASSHLIDSEGYTVGTPDGDEGWAE